MRAHRRWVIPFLAVLLLVAAQAQELEDDEETHQEDLVLDEEDAPAEPPTPSNCPMPQLPANFHVDEKVMDTGWSFKVKSWDGKTSFGTIGESLMNWEKKLTWKWKSEKEATGIQAAISWGDLIHITDCKGVKLAKLKEEIFSGFTNMITKYDIVNNAGAIVGKSEKVEWIGAPEFTIKSGDGQRILAKITRPVFSWGDQWQIQRPNMASYASGGGKGNANDALAQDPRVLVMLAAFKTAHGTSTTKGIIWDCIIGGIVILACGILGLCFFVFKWIQSQDSGGYSQV